MSNMTQPHKTNNICLINCTDSTSSLIKCTDKTNTEKV